MNCLEHRARICCWLFL